MPWKNHFYIAQDSFDSSRTSFQSSGASPHSFREFIFVAGESVPAAWDASKPGTDAWIRLAPALQWPSKIPVFSLATATNLPLSRAGRSSGSPADFPRSTNPVS